MLYRVHLDMNRVWTHKDTVSESDCCLTPSEQFCSYIMAGTFDLMLMMSALYFTNKLSWILIVLVHWNNSPQVDMLLHLDTLAWFRANHTLLLLLNAACLEKEQILICSLWFDPQSIALEKSKLNTTDAVRTKNSEIRVGQVRVHSSL
jgi:hypothetical protein